MQLALTVYDIIRITGGTLLRGEATSLIQRISTDTRTLQRGDLFIPLVGERFDAHDFLPDAERRGARGALVSRETASQLPILIHVTDTLDALSAIAAHHRRRFQVPVTAITGSNGKTSTRAMLASILAQRGPVLASIKSFNNRIGVSLTILELHSDHQFAIFEIGTNRPGEIGCLAEITQPGLAVITNVSATHLEGLGSLERVAEEKAQVLQVAPDAVLNADNRYTLAMRERVSGRCMLFGVHSKADIRVSDIEDVPLQFCLHTPLGVTSVRLPCLGRHHVWNALAAAGAGILLGCSLEHIRQGLETHTPVAMRTQLERVANVVILNDAYNANPASVRAALDLLARMDVSGRRVAVLADMLELGSVSERLHRDIGTDVVRHGIDWLITFGEKARAIGEGARSSGMASSAIQHVSSIEELAQLLLDHVTPEDLVLLKGSRGMQLERVIAFIQRSAGNA